MKRLVLICFLVLAGICVSNAKVVFVSSSQGDDSNNGTSTETPLRTIRKALSVSDTVLLKSGDVFFENIVVRRGLVSKYGGDKKPVLRGYKRIINPCWEKIGDNLWKISLADANYSGFETGGSSMLNNIGCIHEYDKDLIHGRKFQFKKELAKDWDMWQTEHHSKTETSASDFDSLYLYLRYNPNYLQLEFSVSSAGISLSCSAIDGVRIEGFGCGVFGQTRSVVRNCEIDAIGGKTQLTDVEYVCYGNGIELWIEKGMTDCVVENNIITRCYDSGCTLQGSADSPRNIRFKNNVIIDCCQGWEDFLSNDDPCIVYKNCVFENNIIINSGETTGFGYPNKRFKYCHLLSGNIRGNKGMIIRNNIFMGGNFFCSASYENAYKSNVWQGNICIIRRGDYILGNYTGTKDVIRIPTTRGIFMSLKAATIDAIKQYRELTSDMTTKFVVRREKKINRQIARLKKEYLNGNKHHNKYGKEEDFYCRLRRNAGRGFLPAVQG